MTFRPSDEKSVRRIRVFIMDLWCIVPYYNVYLAKALLQQGADVTLGSISYHWDLACFPRHGVRNRPGLLDVVAKLRIRGPVQRRALKLGEAFANMVALALRFTISPPDVLHVQFIPLVEVGAPVEIWFLKYAKLLGIKIIYTVHNELPMDRGMRDAKLYQRIYQLSDALICHTGEAKDRLSARFAIPPGRIHVIPHGPLFQELERPNREEARRKLGFAPDECVVLWQGWLKPYKGVPFLLDAWLEVQRRCTCARLVIAGTGDEECRREVQEKVAALSLDRSVRLDLRFLDAVKELPLYYAAADILVYPYREITTSGALMTGLNFGKAIVTTDLPVFREVLENGSSALIVSYGDTAALAEALLALINDPLLRGRIAANAAQVATRLPNSWEAIARQSVACYEEQCRRPAEA